MISIILAVAGIFVEAESFDRLGGWVVETQSVRQMGSAYLMAHGMGAPVADAETEVKVETAGDYEVWARTRNWVEEWAPGKCPGRFEVLVNGKKVESFAGANGVLGINGGKWAWQLAGKVKLEKGAAKLALHDLTGFNGRCDQIALVPLKDGKWTLPELPVVSPVEDAKENYEFVVIGGGIAGSCTAIAASRSGVKTLCLQDRDVLGGCNSSEVRVGMGGMLGFGPNPALGRVVGEIQPMMSDHKPNDAMYYEDTRKEIAFNLKMSYTGAGAVPGVRPTLRLRQHVYAVEMQPGTNLIAAVIALDMRTGKRVRYRAKWFCDATGDAVIARQAGCETMYGVEPRSRFHEACAPEKAVRQVMGMSVQWLSKECDRDSPFPDISDWALKMDEVSGEYRLYGTWDQETGFFRDMADDTEAIRDYGLLAVFSNWHWMKNVAPRKAEYARRAFSWISPVGGKRESYRVVGDYVFNQNDLHNQVMHPDATAAATWNIDFHFPDPRLEGKFKEPIRSAAYHRGFGGKAIPVPYRSLYARDCGNLFLAGRHISVSHAAFACVRVMRTLGALGEAVGLATAVCKKHDCLPRDVYRSYLEEYRKSLKKGVPPLGQFHCGGFAIGETYHMSTRGYFSIYPAEKGSLSPEVQKEIKSIGFEHMCEHPDFQDRRRAFVLADESRGFLHYYDSFSPKAGFKVAVRKPVWDLKQVGAKRYRTVCYGGFQITDFNERKVVENFTHPSLSGPDFIVTAICDLKDGGFIASVNPQKTKDKVVLLRHFNAARELVATYRVEGCYYARSLQWDRDGETLLLSWEKGFSRVRLPKLGEKAEILANFLQPDGRNLFDVVPDPTSDGYVAGCGYGGGLVRFAADGSVKSQWFVPTDTGKESRFYAQVLPQPNGHVYMAHWTGHGFGDSFKGWQAVEFDQNGKAVWHLDSPDRYGSISGILIAE